jgi:GcrA cell cycle regulator
MVWNEETIRSLKDLWTEGHSTAEIGRRLGVSKNAIVGKAHRLDLDARPSPIRREPLPPPADRCGTYSRASEPTLPPLPSANVGPAPAELASNVQPLRPAPAAEPVATVEPERAPVPVMRPSAPVPARRPAPSCCWPIGDPGTKAFRFCDDASLPGKPYCDEHAKLAYVRIRDRKEDAA